jgi:uncharacterized repeat protein (TIGR01451 family)
MKIQIISNNIFKKYIVISITVISFLFTFNANAQCNTCDVTNPSGNNVTIQAGETVCITSNISVNKLDLEDGSTLCIAQGASLTVNNNFKTPNNGSVEINIDGTLTVNNTFNTPNNGFMELNIEGTLFMGQVFNIKNELVLNNNGTLSVSGNVNNNSQALTTINNTGTINFSSQFNSNGNSNLSFINCGVVNLSSGMNSNSGSAVFVNSGQLNTSGSFQFGANGSNSATLENYGTITATSNFNIQNNTILYNEGLIKLFGNNSNLTQTWIKGPDNGKIGYFESNHKLGTNNQTDIGPNLNFKRTNASSTSNNVFQNPPVFVDANRNSTTQSSANVTLDCESDDSCSAELVLLTNVCPNADGSFSDLSVTYTVDNPNPTPNDDVVFTITATNLGSADDTNVTVQSLLPDGYTFVSANPSTGSYDNSTGDWTIGDLASSASVTLTITATVNATGSYGFNLDVSGDVGDTNLSNNTDTASVVVSAPPVTQDFESGDRNIEIANCWLFFATDIKGSPSITPINGSYSMRTGQLSSMTNTSELISPWFDISAGDLTFDTGLTALNGGGKYLDVFLVDTGGNETQILDHEFTSASVQNFSIPITTTGVFRVKFEYYGDGGNSRGILDDILIPGTNVSDPQNNCLPSSGQLVDTDNDGVPNLTDLDDDNDGIPDAVENATAKNNNDTDGDGIPDSLDLDSDGDGILDIIESGDPNTANEDPDGDGRVNGSVGSNGLLDAAEDAADSGVLANNPLDTDGDLTPDFQDADTDNDGISDLIEGGTNPFLDTNNDGVLDALADNDGDGIADVVDANDPGASGVSATVPDTDGDGTPDYRDLDSDNDGINDVEEAGMTDADGDAQVDTPGTIANGTLLPSDGVSGTPDYSTPPSNSSNSPLTPGQDANGDGIVDDNTDTDGDGIPDSIDGMYNAFGDAPLDSDNDGIPDNTDLDDDNDGIPDSIENATATNGGDTDGDGVPDSLDLDSDGDGFFDVVESNDPNAVDNDNDGQVDGPVGANGIPDAIEDSTDSGVLANNPSDTDGDGTPDFQDIDSDNDGITDAAEGDGDVDGDGVPNYLDLDSDNDGIPDLVEAGGTDADNNGIADDTTDTDGDGLADVFDADNGGEALADTDSDNDGIPNRLDADSDNDGIPDVVEAQSTVAYIAPSGNDADSDGIDDSFDADAGNSLISSPVNTDENNIASFNPDNIPDYLDTDSDGDGTSDQVESGITADTSGSDADNDGILDGYDNYDLNEIPGAPSGVNSDNDGQTATNPFTTAPGNSEPDWRNNGTSLSVVLTSICESDVPKLQIEIQATGFDPSGLNAQVTWTAGAFDTSLSATTPPSPLVPVTVQNITVPTAMEAFPGAGIWVATFKTIWPGAAESESGSAENWPGWVFDDNGSGIWEAKEDGYSGYRDDATTIEVAINPESGGVVSYPPTTPSCATNPPSSIDNDGDGIADIDDIDDDNDGIPDTVENASALNGGDTDGDGIPDSLDLDSDGDGIFDIVESGDPNTANEDADGDGRVDGAVGANGLLDAAETAPESGALANNPVDTDSKDTPDFQDIDSDNDGISDLVEGGSDPAIDANNDGVIDDQTDTDGDGAADAVDADNGGTTATTPDTDGDGKADYRDLDSDNDGINDIEESGLTDSNGDGQKDNPDNLPDGSILANGSTLPDEDNNGTPDFREPPVNAADSPLTSEEDADADGVVDDNTDTDGDGIPDAVDGLPNDFGDAFQDTDGDGIPDFVDVDDDNDGILDTVEGDGDDDNDGIPNRLDLDSDNDGIPDNVEAQSTLNYFVPVGNDTNRDGLDDAYDATCAPCGVVFGQAITSEDTDGDGTPDYLDTDTDNDGILDIDEAYDASYFDLSSTTIGENGLYVSTSQGDNYDNVAGMAYQSGSFMLSDTDTDTNADGSNADPANNIDFDFRDADICINIDIKVYLAGALINNGNATGSAGEPLMRDNLRSSIWPSNLGENMIPTTEPYTNMNSFTHVGKGGGEQATADAFDDRGQDSVVDWVFLEFRDKNDNTNVLETRAAFVQRDGDVVDVDGESLLEFCSLDVEYYVVVRHRNHLGVMTAAAEDLRANNFVDFSNNNSDRSGVFNFGTSHPQGSLGGYDYNGLSQQSLVNNSPFPSNVKALWLGNAKHDKKIKYSAPNDDFNTIFFNKLMYPGNNSNSLAYDFAIFYDNGDIDLNGKLKFSAPGDDHNVLFFQILFHPLNSSNQLAFDFIYEQIP